MRLHLNDHKACGRQLFWIVCLLVGAQRISGTDICPPGTQLTVDLFDTGTVADCREVNECDPSITIPLVDCGGNSFTNADCVAIAQTRSSLNLNTSNPISCYELVLAHRATLSCIRNDQSLPDVHCLELGCDNGCSGLGLSCDASTVPGGYVTKAGQHDCSGNATCTDTPGSFTCDCLTGFAGDGTSCSEIDECLTASTCPTRSDCENVVGSFLCHCHAGFGGSSCTDINECNANHTCDTGATCTNTEGSFDCACNQGFFGNGTRCVDVNECGVELIDCAGRPFSDSDCVGFGVSVPGGVSSCTELQQRFANDSQCDNGRLSFACSTFACDGGDCTGADCIDAPFSHIIDRQQTPLCASTATCTNQPGTYDCSCNAGYSGSGVSCSNVDECTGSIHNCDGEAACTDLEGSFSCACNVGWSGDGITCDNLVECALATDDCDVQATCTDTNGSFTCACNAGWAGIGTRCANVDECSSINNCHSEALCGDTDGSFTCVCNSGWSGDGLVCLNEDECALSTDDCDIQATCSDEIGSFSCTCNTGWTGSGPQCTNMNECILAIHDCDTQASCVDSNGSFTCACNVGWLGDGNSCTNIQECSLQLDNCDTEADCTDTNGSFECLCNTGWRGSGTVCANIDECTEGSNSCNAQATCTDVDGSFLCACNTGWSGDGVGCENIDECTIRTDNCHVRASCTNVDGSFTCQCNVGFSGNGEDCTDIDECLGVNDCDANAACSNNPGSFSCACNSGFAGSGVLCFNVSTSTNHALTIVGGDLQTKGGQTGFILTTEFFAPPFECFDTRVNATDVLSGSGSGFTESVDTGTSCVDVGGPLHFADGTLVSCAYLSQWDCDYDLSGAWSDLPPSTTVASRCPVMCHSCTPSVATMAWVDSEGRSCEWYEHNPSVRCNIEASEHCCACGSGSTVAATELPVAKPTLWSSPLEVFPGFANVSYVVQESAPAIATSATGRIVVEVEDDGSLLLGYELRDLTPTLTTLNELADNSVSGSGSQGPPNSLSRVPGSSGPVPTGVITVADVNGGNLSVAYTLQGLIPTLTTTISTFPGFSLQGPTGTVTVKDNVDGSVLVEYSLSNLRPNEAETLQIHEGTSCSAAGLHHFDSGTFSDPWFHLYSADSAGNARGSFNVTTGFTYTGNNGRVFVINGFNERSGCGVLVPLQGRIAIVDSTTCSSSNSAMTWFDNSVLGSDPWTSAKYTIGFDGTSQSSVSIFTGYNFDENVGHAIVVSYEEQGIACSLLEPVRSSIRIHSGSSCATIASVGVPHFNPSVADPFDLSTQYVSSSANLIVGSLTIDTGYRFFENRDRTVVVDHGGTPVSCAVLDIAVIPFFWECFNVNENSDCGIDLSLSNSQVIAPNQLTADRYRFTARGHLATNASAQDTVLIDILNESIPVSIAFDVEGVNFTTSGSRALPSSTVDLTAVLNEQELIDGLHLPDDNHTLTFIYEWSVFNFNFSDQLNRLQGSNSLHIPNNENDPRFSQDSTIGVTVDVSAFSGRLQRNISGSSFVNFTIPPGPFGGTLAASVQGGQLALVATGWAAGFAIGQPALPSVAQLRYEFFLCTSRDCLAKSFFTTTPISSNSFSVLQFPGQSFVAGARVSWAWGFTDVTVNVSVASANLTAQELLQEFNVALATNNGPTIAASVLRVISTFATGTDSEFRELFGAVLRGTASRYPLLGFESVSDLLEAALTAILRRPELLEPCSGFYCSLSATTLFPEIITDVQSYVTAALLDRGTVGAGTLTAQDVSAISKVLSLADTALRGSPEIHFASGVTTSVGGRQQLFSSYFNAILEIVGVGRGPRVPGIQPIISDGLGAADVYGVLQRLTPEMANLGSGSIVFPDVESLISPQNRVTLSLTPESFPLSVPTSNIDVIALYTQDPLATKVFYDWNDQMLQSTSPGILVKFYLATTVAEIAPTSYFIDLPHTTTSFSHYSTQNIPRCYVWDASSETWTDADTLVRTVVFTATDVTCEVHVVGWMVSIFSRIDQTGDVHTVAAPKGTFQAATDFVECGWGSYQNRTGQSGCIPIPQGSYCASFSKTACEEVTDCPIGTFCAPADGRIHKGAGDEAVSDVQSPWICKGDSTLCHGT
eukprot:m.99434 g.99434  ORF g.99434 m.99434 type:complete len:2093 (+) comp12461_c0_seq1:242-6520(+)